MRVNNILFIILFISIGCSQSTDKVDLDLRNDTYYSKETNEPYTGKVVSYYSTGELFEEEELLNGKTNGIYKVYYQNGNLMEKGSFIRGISNGKFLKYYENGSLKSERYWSYGKFDGEWKFYHKNGNLEKWITYDNGKVVSKSPFFSSF